ncbi:MAG: SDR family NAD(P)-dependent oxidoreductase [Actinobacteria bacterium]|nr:MAG: SDR family NAD(P)-dependent oxidoreductase [Actinomycetota bacterium]
MSSTRSPVPSSELEGQVALVTGGGRGIGANIARELAAAGMRVAVSARSREQVDGVAREIGGVGIVADVSKEDDVQRMVDDVGAIDILVANAGIGNRGVAWELDPDEWWRVFEVNVLGVHLCCRTVIPRMLDRGSCVPPGCERDGVHGVESGGVPLRRDARQRPCRADRSLRAEPRTRADGDDGGEFPGRRAVDAARMRAAPRARACERALRPPQRTVPARGARPT